MLANILSSQSKRLTEVINGANKGQLFNNTPTSMTLLEQNIQMSSGPLWNIPKWLTVEYSQVAHCGIFPSGPLWNIPKWSTVEYSQVAHCGIFPSGPLWNIPKWPTVEYSQVVHCGIFPVNQFKKMKNGSSAINPHAILLPNHNTYVQQYYQEGATGV